MRATEVAYESDILAVQNERLQRGKWATVPLGHLTAFEPTNAQIAGSIKATKKKKLWRMTMKSRKLQLLPALVLFLSLFSGLTVHAQITPSADTYTNTATPTTNYGSKTLLDVDGATQTTYIQFNLASIPAGASVSQATLKLYVNAVTTA